MDKEQESDKKKPQKSKPQDIEAQFQKLMLEQEQKAEEMMKNLTLSSMIKLTKDGFDQPESKLQNQKSEKQVVESSGKGDSQDQVMKSDSEDEKPQPAKKAKAAKKPAKDSSQDSSDNNIPTG